MEVTYSLFIVKKEKRTCQPLDMGHWLLYVLKARKEVGRGERLGGVETASAWEPQPQFGFWLSGSRRTWLLSALFTLLPSVQAEHWPTWDLKSFPSVTFCEARRKGVKILLRKSTWLWPFLLHNSSKPSESLHMSPEVVEHLSGPGPPNSYPSHASIPEVGLHLPCKINT